MAWSDTQVAALDPHEDMQAMQQAMQWWAEKRRVESSFTESDALNLANFARIYPQASNEMMAAVVETHLPYDMPQLRELVAAESEQGGNLLARINDGIKWTSRNALAVADSIYENALGRPARFALGLAQGAGIEEAWDTAGSSVIEEMVRAKRQGREYTLGTGFFAQPQEPEDVLEYREAFQQSMPAEGATMDDMLRSHQLGIQAMPVDTAANAILANEQRRMNITRGDTTYEVPFSLGRAVAAQIVRPETVPFSIISGLMDAPMRVGLDPLNVPADELTRFARSRRLIVPVAEDVRTVPGLADAQGTLGRTRPTGQIYVAPDEDIAAAWARLPQNIADRTAALDAVIRAGDQTPEAIQVARNAVEELTFVHDRINRIARKTGEAPEEVYRQFIVGHERGHQAMIASGTDEVVDEITEQFGSILGTPHEMDASRTALDILDRRPGRAARELELYASTGISDAGWRPYASPTSANRFLSQRRGQRVVNFLAESTDMHEINRLVGDIPLPDRLTLRLSNDPATIEEILRHHLGRTVEHAPRIGVRPRIIGARAMADPDLGARGGFTLIDDDTAIGRWYRRYFESEAGGSALMLDPMDPDQAMNGIHDWMTTAGATSREVDAALVKVASNPNDFGVMMEVVDDMENILRRRLGQLGYDRLDVDRVVGEWRDAQRIHRMYFDDALGGAVFEQMNRDFQIYNRVTKEYISYKIPQAAHEVQFAHRNLAVPSVREVRRMTSRVRAITDKFRVGLVGEEGPLGLRQQWGQARLDNFMAVWRNAALLRGGWMLRVLPDEFARMMAGGYTHALGNPLSYITLSMTEMSSIAGRSFDDVVEEFGGLGTNNMFRDIQNNPLTGTRFDPAYVTWTPARVGEQGYAQGLSRVLVQFHNSDLVRRIADMGVDEAFHFFRNTPEGNQILRRIAAQAGTGNVLGRIADDPMVLMAKLNALEADLARYSGGSWVRRSDDLPGQWVDMYGELYDDVDGLLNDLPNSQQFFVLDPGSQRIRQLVGQGVDSLSSDPDRIAEIRRIQEGTDFRAVAVNHDEALVWEHLTREMDELTDLDALDDVLGAATPDDMIYVYDGDELVGRYTRAELTTTLPDPELGGVLIPEIMDQRDFLRLEAQIMDLYDDVHAAPDFVRTPDPGRMDKANRWGNQTVNTAFHYLGTVPTVKLMRSPFFRARYTEEMARFYIYGDDPTRALIVGWADENDVAHLFNRFVERQMMDQGIKRPSAVDQLGLTIDEMDEIASRISVNTVRDLLYDLSKSSNAADALRLMIPFGDAWFEVLSRWVGLMNPYTAVRGAGQPIRNYRRAQQGIAAAKQNGWFQEDQFGQESFVVPGWPWMQRHTSWQVGRNISTDQMMFIDPSEPRSIVLPGFGPLVQFPASLLTPKLPSFMRQASRWAVFGDFPPTDTSSLSATVQSFLPTPYRRVVQAAYSDEYRQEYADEIVENYGMLLSSTDPRWGDETVDRRNATMEMARKIGSTLALTRILDAALLPGQPRNEAEVRVVQDVLNEGVDPFWLDVSAISSELRAAEEILGSREAAQWYFHERFGFDPLESAAGSYQVKARPVTELGFNYLQANPELRAHADLTLMAFVPSEEGAEFFQPAWYDQFTEGAREKYELEEATAVINGAKGNRAFQFIQEQFDAKLAEAEQAWGRDSNRYRAYRDELVDWKNDEIYAISVQYWAWGSDKSVVGATERPTYGNYLKEVLNIGDPTTTAHSELSSVNPELVGFYSHVRDLWLKAEEQSMESGTHKWWRTSETLSSNYGDAAHVRRWFTDGLSWYVTTQMGDPTAKAGAQWLMDRVVAPMMAGYDFDDPMILDASQPPNLTAAAADDTLTRTEFLPRIEDELVGTND